MAFALGITNKWWFFLPLVILVLRQRLAGRKLEYLLSSSIFCWLSLLFGLLWCKEPVLNFSAEAPKVYAYGSLVLWSREKRSLTADLKFLAAAETGKIAVANPKLAPYGEAAIQALTYYKLYPAVEKKLVFGESIAQVNQYVLSGAAPVGFTAKSVVLDPASKGKGTWIEINRKAYLPIAQSVVLLKNGKSSGARQFYRFLSGDKAKAIFRKYGYLTE